MKILKIISGFPGLYKTDYPDTKILQTDYPENGSRVSRAFRIYLTSYRFDYIVFNMLHSDAYILCLLKYILPFNRCRIIVVDLILPIPTSLSDKLKTSLRAVLLKKIHKFFHYAKNTTGFTKYYGISSEKFCYIPFKTNNIDSIINIIPRDDGYVFVGGQTRRDFRTLFEAIDGLNYPVRVVAPNLSILHKHGSTIENIKIPGNVTRITDATTPDTFTREIAGARLVVIPIVKQNISPSGIGVYLQCMSLKKCVIISSGPSVDDILIDRYHALIVPPEDPQALRNAIISVYENETLRNEIAEQGYKYALSLGDEHRLNQSIVEKLIYDKFHNEHV